jgi:hypothetical protein
MEPAAPACEPREESEERDELTRGVELDEDQAPFRPQDPVDLGEEARLVGHVMKDVDEVDSGEAAVSERQRLAVGGDGAARRDAASPQHADRVDVAGRDTHSGQRFDVQSDATRAGSEVEDRCAGRKNVEMLRATIGPDTGWRRWTTRS